MSPVAHALLCAVRYAHGRSLHPYEEVIAAVRELWPSIDHASRRYWLGLVDNQVPADLQRMIDAHDGERSTPVTRGELEEELRAYRELIAWCAARL